METTVVKLAAELCGADEDSVLLQALCDAAVEFWRRRLKGAPAEESGKGTLRCAAAFTAAADYLGKNCAGAESFTVGDVTVRGASGQSAMALAGALRQSAERLMERFVRGDDSRNTEGSGLGLNIAKSLMELQNGQLQLLVDGDLFKATLFFPRPEQKSIE